LQASKDPVEDMKKAFLLYDADSKGKITVNEHPP